ncbi:chorismate-binding protein [Candidatus Deianiraea vastatrix]|uniref:Aminodeoxychorismate synthase component 1 n=1 Tax=Candidatus Deianiraea vastatrix TaxID=2163644 RepID=A0A5B8XET3_9RICK|nr:chorismate-binding protein [Candidatus Deianiraea vastatrix]QED23818.1 Aminodeoxychorismate synthase component 1 [Candidatus Deianiraea vastatrix]
MFYDLKTNKVVKFHDKVETLIAYDSESLISILENIEKYTQKGYFIAGFISYEAGCYILPKKVYHKKLKYPLLHFDVFSKIEEEDIEIPDITNGCIYDVSYTENEDEYNEKIANIKSHLKNGDTYQTNYTISMNFSANLKSDELFYALCKEQKSEFAALLQYDDYKILSFSPELFLCKRGNLLTSKPMKGTFGINESDDSILRNEKVISENSIIIDLIRNDMSIIAEKGSVEVENPFEIQNFGTLRQLISTVKCEVRDKSFYDIIRALFPCGSITGAPKIKTMEIIAENESRPREMYCGAIGYIMPNNDFCFNVAIRTIVLKNDKYSMGIGGGILYESCQKDEFNECKLKSQFIRKVNKFDILEEVKIVNSQVQDYELHIENLKYKADYFGFNFIKPILPSLKDCSSGILQIMLSQDGKYSYFIKDYESCVKKVEILDIEKDFSKILGRCSDISGKRSDIFDIIMFNDGGIIANTARGCKVFIKKDDMYFSPICKEKIVTNISSKIIVDNLDARVASMTIDELKSADFVYLLSDIYGFFEVKI